MSTVSCYPMTNVSAIISSSRNRWRDVRASTSAPPFPHQPQTKPHVKSTMSPHQWAAVGNCLVTMNLTCDRPQLSLLALGISLALPCLPYSFTHLSANCAQWTSCALCHWELNGYPSYVLRNRPRHLPVRFAGACSLVILAKRVLNEYEVCTAFANERKYAAVQSPPRSAPDLLHPWFIRPILHSLH